MKITDIQIEKVHIPLLGPIKITFATLTYAENVLIKVSTDEGLVGMDPLDIEKIHAVMDKAFYGNGSAKCAIDLAMYDLAGKKAGLPVYKRV